MARSRNTDSEPGTGPARVGIALAGGGPAGAIYEIGALRALEEALPSLDFTDLHVYVGVSAGAFIASNLANGLSTAQMVRAIVKPEPGEHPFTPETFFTPNRPELAMRGRRLPTLLKEVLQQYAIGKGEVSFTESLLRLGHALPVSVFDNEPIRKYLRKIYAKEGRTDDFRQLKRQLFVVATDLDAGRAVRFGEPGMDQVPISRAVQASSALPGLYSPVEIDGRYYVDGVLLKTLHASVALEAGADLLLCINPIVPIDTASAVERGVMVRGKLVDRGLPTLLSQTFRTLIHSRMKLGMSSYDKRYKAKIVLLEPERDDYSMFFTNIFGFSERRSVCEHAYRATRRVLLERYEELAPLFGSRGLALSREVLEDPERDLWAGVGLHEKRSDVGDLVNRLDRAFDRVEALVS